MKIISWNINGLRAAVKNGFADKLKEFEADVFCLQEIKLDDVARAKIDFDFANYFEYFFPAERKGYSGTGILSKKELPVTKGIGEAEFDCEGRTQTADLGDCYLLNVYFPNSQEGLKRLDYKTRFNEALLNYAKELEKQKPVIITGDFNVAREEIDIARPKENHGSPGFSDEERDWARKYLAAGFRDTFRELHPDEVKYTWWTYRFGARSRNVGWRIDYFLVSESLLPRVKRAEILDDIPGSDHCPVVLELDF